MNSEFTEDAFYSFDGAELGLSVWETEIEASPDYVIVGVHGMNDYAGAFRWSAPYWASQGVTVYAYDQRGFGRSPHNGIWPEEDLMREDLRTAVSIVRRRHPDAQIAVVGVSMGGAVSMTAFASDTPPDADLLVLSGPGLRGWGALPFMYRLSLWSTTRLNPGWVVNPPKQLVKTITPTDNREVMETQWYDPYFQKTNRIDSVYGVVSVMENAHRSAAGLPTKIPTLFLYGDRDEIVPKRGVKRTAPHLPAHVKTAYYEGAYHMLLRDIGRQRVLDDILSFIRSPADELPSGAPELPWRG